MESKKIIVTGGMGREKFQQPIIKGAYGFEGMREAVDAQSMMPEYPVWDKQFTPIGEAFTGELNGELVWISYDHNDGYQEWGISTHPDRDRNNGYITKQVWLVDTPAEKIGVERKEQDEIEDAIYGRLDECEVKGFESEWTDKGKAAVMIAEYVIEYTDQYKDENERLKKQVDALYGNSLSMGETNRVMGERLLRYEEALKEINELTWRDSISSATNIALTALNQIDK